MSGEYSPFSLTLSEEPTGRRSAGTRPGQTRRQGNNRRHQTSGQRRDPRQSRGQQNSDQSRSRTSGQRRDSRQSRSRSRTRRNSGQVQRSPPKGSITAAGTNKVQNLKYKVYYIRSNYGIFYYKISKELLESFLTLNEIIKLNNKGSIYIEDPTRAALVRGTPPKSEFFMPPFTISEPFFKSFRMASKKIRKSSKRHKHLKKKSKPRRKIEKKSKKKNVS